MKKRLLTFLASFIVLILLYYLILSFFPVEYFQNGLGSREFMRVEKDNFFLGRVPFEFVGANIKSDEFEGMSYDKKKGRVKELIFRGDLSRIKVFRVNLNKDQELAEEVIKKCEVYGCFVIVAFDDINSQTTSDIEKFKSSVTDFIKMYKESKAIFAWEIASFSNNEENRVPSGFFDQAINYVKSVDPNHLVVAGGNGKELIHGNSTFIDYKFSQAKSDFCVFQYNEETEFDDTYKKKTENLFKEISNCNNKPVVLESFSLKDLPKNKKIEFYEFIFKTSKENNINPMIHSWSEKDNTGVDKDDHLVISNIFNFY